MAPRYPILVRKNCTHLRLYDNDSFAQEQKNGVILGQKVEKVEDLGVEGSCSYRSFETDIWDTKPIYCHTLNFGIVVEVTQILG